MSDPKPRRRGGYLGLFLPFILVLLALGGWTVWWFMVAHEVETRMDKQAAELGRSGYAVSWRDREINGWPFRTNVDLKDVQVKTPSGAVLSAPELGGEAETYAIGKWVIAAPQGVVWTRATGGAVKIDGQAIRASISGADHFPPNIAIELRKPVFTPTSGADPFPLASAEIIDAYLRPKAGDPGAGEFLFRIEGGKGRPGGMLDSLAQGQAFLIRWEGAIEHLDRAKPHAWPRMVRGWTDAGGDISSNHAEFVAGDTSLEAASPVLTISSDGRLAGDVDLKVKAGPKFVPAVGLLCHGWSSTANVCSGTTFIVLPDGAGAVSANLKLNLDGKDTRIAGQRLAGAPKIF
jgi:hypothetical protein